MKMLSSEAWFIAVSVQAACGIITIIVMNGSDRVTSMHCKICGNKSSLFDSVDFTKNCNERSGYIIPKSGMAVDYYRCGTCAFIFTSYFDAFSPEDFAQTLYNEDYIKVDPLYPEIRPKSNAVFLSSVLDHCYLGKSAPHVLDYGAGSGKLGDILERRYKIISYDPLNPLCNTMPEGKFDIIFSSEVIEHVPFPQSLVKSWFNLLESGGVILFSTLLQPPDIDIVRASWWYISPRNGHVSIFSRKSLTYVFAENNLQYEALSNEWHMALHRGGSHRLDIQKLKSAVDKLPIGFIPI